MAIELDWHATSGRAPGPGAQVRARLGGLAVLCAVLLLVAFNLNYLVISWFGAPGARLVVPVAPEAPILAIFVVLAAAYVVYERGRRDLLAIAIGTSLLGFCALTAAISLVVHGSVRAAVTLLVPAVVMACSWGLTRQAGPGLMRACARWLPLLPFITVAVLLAFAAAGRINFGLGWAKPQIIGGIHSTEIAIFVGLQLFYCLHALDVARQAGRINIFAWLAAVLALLLLLWMLSVASLLIVLLLLALRPLLLSGRRGAGWIGFGVVLVAAAGVAATFGTGEYFNTLAEAKLRDYSDEGVRLPTLLLLLQFIQAEPLTGIGLGEFVNRSYLPRLLEGLYPHNNLLGIAAELGLPAASVYLMFVIATMAGGLRAIRRQLAAAPAASLWPIAVLAWSAFTYLQAKGLVQDTWQLKETYFWAGVLLACLHVAPATRVSVDDVRRAGAAAGR